MDRLNLIQEKAQEVLGAYRGPVFLFDLAAGLLLIIYVALLTAERTLQQQKRNHLQEKGRYVGQARKVASFFLMAWMLAVASYGSVWSKHAYYKVYPIFGFFCAATVEGLEMMQRQTAWEPRLFLRNVLMAVAVGVLVTLRVFQQGDWKILLVPAFCALPLLSYALWPRQDTFTQKPIPYPDATVLIPGTYVAAWLLATMNYGVPSFIQGVRGKVFRGAVVALLAGVAVFFARLVGAIIAWFARFQGSVSMAGYATYAFVGFALSTVFVGVLSAQLSSWKMAILWIPLFITLTLFTALQLHWPKTWKDAQIQKEIRQLPANGILLQKSASGGTATVSSSSNSIPTLDGLLAAGVNNNPNLTTGLPDRKLAVDHLLLSDISMDVIPLLVRKHIPTFHVPWMFDGVPKTEAQVGDILYDPWLWIQPGQNQEAILRSEPLRNANIFVQEGPYADVLAMQRTPATPVSFYGIVLSTPDTIDPKATLSYGSDVTSFGDQFRRIMYLTRRVEYWRILVKAYVHALGKEMQQNPTFDTTALLGLPEGLSWNQDLLTRWLTGAHQMDAASAEDVYRLLQSTQPPTSTTRAPTAFSGTPAAAPAAAGPLISDVASPLPLVFFDRGQTTEARLEDFLEYAQSPWPAQFAALAPSTGSLDAPEFSIIVSYPTSRRTEAVDLADFFKPGGVLATWQTTPPTFADVLFQHGPEATDGSQGYPSALLYMLLFLHSDAQALMKYVRTFWTDMQPTAMVPMVPGPTPAWEHVLHWMRDMTLDSDRISAEQLIQQVPVYRTMLREVFDIKQDLASRRWYIPAHRVPLLYDLLLLRQNPTYETASLRTAAVRERLLQFMASLQSVDAQALVLLAGGSVLDRPQSGWRVIHTWAQKVVDETTHLALLLYVVSSDMETDSSMLYPLRSLAKEITLQRSLQKVLIDEFKGTPPAPVLTDVPPVEWTSRFSNFGRASLLQTLQNFMWLLGLVITMGIHFKKEQGNVLVGIFDNYEGLGHYRRYAYGAIFLLLGTGFLQLLSILRWELLSKPFEDNPTRESLPYLIFFAVSSLYMAPGLVHQISRQQLRTLYFLVLFFVFLFFAPLRPFLPLSKDKEDKWNLLGDRYTNRVNAIASGLTLLLLVIMVAFGFFDHSRPWKTSVQVLVCGILIICSAFASPLYVLLKDFKDTTQMPSELAQMIKRADEWQQDMNKGIFYSLVPLLLTSIVTWKYLRVKSADAYKPRRVIDRPVGPLEFVDSDD